VDRPHHRSRANARHPTIEDWYEDTATDKLPPKLDVFVRDCAERARAALAQLNDLDRVRRDPFFRE
jgi:hypothetical protein